MKLFIDSANVEHIREISSWGILAGVTTNPSLIAREGRDFKQVITEITQLVDGPISAEVIGETSEKMVEEAEELAKIHMNVIIKIPMTGEGLKAVNILRNKGIKTNVTLVFSTAQALLAARAGANFVSPFVGRLDDVAHDGIKLISDIAHIFKIYNIDTEIIAASIRHSPHVVNAAMSGADIATIPYDVLKQMLIHPLTDLGIERFLADWEKSKSRLEKK